MVACPTCATPVLGWTGTGPACPTCGLPAAGHAGYVVARMDATLTEFRADRDRLLQTLAGLARPAPMPPPAQRTPPVLPTPAVGPAHAPAAARHPRRLSPQQLLLGTGAVLLVSAAIAFAAVAWESLGLVGQASILLTLTAVVCSASVSAARRGLPTTAEALAMAGLALTVVDLVGARVMGLAGLDEIPLRAHAALTLGTVVIVGLALARLSPGTKAWLLGALVAAQPLAFLALPDSARTPVPLVATALSVSIVNVAITRVVKGPLAGTAIGFAAIWWAIGTVLGTAAAWSEPMATSAVSAVLVFAAGAGAVLSARPIRLDRVGVLARILDLTVLAAGALALAGALHQADVAGVMATGVLGLAALTAVCLVGPPLAVQRRRWEHPILAASGMLCSVAIVQLAAGRNWLELAALTGLGAGCSAGVAVLNRGFRVPGAVLTAALSAAAILLLVADGFLADRAGWLLALAHACTLGVAGVRVGHREERPLATTAALIGLAAITSTASTFAWGQLALQMSVVGAALLAYGRVSEQRAVLLVGLADLVLATWIGAAGHSVTTPEVYTLPAVVALLLAAGPGLWTAPSWTVWGAPLLVGLVPSTLVVLHDPNALRLVLLVSAAAACAVLGTLTHRQAPFLIGLGVLLTVAVSELGPYAAVLPRWLSLGVAGVLLLAVGATYERRLVQAREAIGWVGALR